MENEEKWNTFTKTGRVQDYLAYAGMHEDKTTNAVDCGKETDESNRTENRFARE